MKEYRYGHPKFYELTKVMEKLHNDKNKQYATIDNPLGNFHRGASIVEKLLNPKIKNKALAYNLILASKQMDGVMEIIGEGKERTPDSFRDKALDIAVYMLIAIILAEEE